LEFFTVKIGKSPSQFGKSLITLVLVGHGILQTVPQGCQYLRGRGQVRASDAHVDDGPPGIDQAAYLPQFFGEVVFLYIFKSLGCVHGNKAFLYSPSTLKSPTMIFSRDLALAKSSYFSKVTSTKKAYFQGVSITGRDWILVRFMLQSLITLSTVAKLPRLWSVIKRRLALLISSLGKSLFFFFRRMKRVEFTFIVCISEAMISKSNRSAAIFGAMAAILAKPPSLILFAVSAVSTLSTNLIWGWALKNSLHCNRAMGWECTSWMSPIPCPLSTIRWWSMFR